MYTYIYIYRARQYYFVYLDGNNLTFQHRFFQFPICSLSLFHYYFANSIWFDVTIKM